TADALVATASAAITAILALVICGALVMVVPPCVRSPHSVHFAGAPLAPASPCCAVATVATRRVAVRGQARLAPPRCDPAVATAPRAASSTLRCSAPVVTAHRGGLRLGRSVAALFQCRWRVAAVTAAHRDAPCHCRERAAHRRGGRQRAVPVHGR